MADNTALIKFLESQILAAQSLIAALNEDEPDETVEVPAAAPAAKRGRPAKKAAPVVEPEPEDEDEDEAEEEDGDTARRAELEAMKILALRNLATKRGFKEEGVKAASKSDLVDAILSDEKEEAKKAVTASDDADEEEDETEEVELTREQLSAMGIRKVKALAKEQGITQADMAGLNLDGVIDLILNEGDAVDEDEEDPEDEDADDAETTEDEAEEDEEEDGDFYTREDFEKMSLAELKVIGRQYEKDYPGFKVPAAIKKPALIDLLMSDDEAEDDE